MAERMPGVTGENLLVLLERRLDSMVYRLGFASSLAQARQIVRHGHIDVDDKPVTVPSYLLEVGEVVSIIGRQPHQEGDRRGDRDCRSGAERRRGLRWSAISSAARCARCRRAPT